MRKNDSPGRLIQKAKSSGSWFSRNSKRKRRVMGGMNPAQIPMKPSNCWIRIVSFKMRNMDPWEFNESTPRVSKRQGHGLDSSKDASHSGMIKRGQLSHRDPPFPPWSRKKGSRGAIVGVKGQATRICAYVGPRAQSEDSR